MPFFRVDDDFALHPKAIAAGNAACGLWVRAGSYASKYLTEGFVAASTVTLLGGRPRDAKALVDAGLWEVVPGGWMFHQWEGRQPTKEQVEQDRAAAAERQRRAREKAREKARENRPETPTVTRDVTPPVTRDSQGESRSPRPGPARSYVLTLVSRLAAGDAHEPPPAEVIASWQDLAGPAVDLDAEAAAYLARFGDRPPRDERGAWLGWLRKAAERTTAAAIADRPTPTPATPHCPIHPEHPTGSRACPRCLAEAAPAPDLRAALRRPAQEAS